RIKQGSADEAVLRTWVNMLAALPDDQLAEALKYREKEAAGAGPKRATGGRRRGPPSQYNNKGRDPPEKPPAPSAPLPPADYVNGFKNQYQAQGLTPLLVEAYSAAAEKLARNAFRGGDTHKLIPCKPSPSCRETFVRSFGLKAFRRPLEPDEVKRYAALFPR